jgi:hypothetical protein
MRSPIVKCSERAWQWAFQGHETGNKISMNPFILRLTREYTTLLLSAVRPLQAVR